jgi:hypothetical protein
VRVSIPKNSYAPPATDNWLKRDHGGLLHVTRLHDQTLLLKNPAPGPINICHKIIKIPFSWRPKR